MWIQRVSSSPLLCITLKKLFVNVYFGVETRGFTLALAYRGIA